MKSEVELWFTCLSEAGEQHHVRTLRDKAYALSRIEHEGLAFLAITLPRFEKDLLSAISSGRVSSDHFAGFKRSGGLPCFMKGFLSRMFEGTGVLKPELDPGLLRSVRQVLLLLSKVELPVSRSRERKAIAAYVQTDELLPELNERLRNRFRSTARVLLQEYLAEVESRIWSRNWTPRHSGGALATRETPNGRWANATWTERLQAVTPWWDDLTLCPSESQDLDVSVLARNDEPPALMALVPKTMKGPRVIVEEPCHMQYIQQGVLHVMSEVLRERRFRHLYDAFAWDSQEPNRDLARFGSISGAYATIDLSEASDRVSLDLASLLLDSAPYLRSVVLACRSESVRLPDGKIHRLSKFASMGSSLCFPIESMVFFVIASIAQAESHAVAPSVLRKTLKYGRLRVYGDDIIVPETVAQSALYWLETYGLKVNVEKTFTSGLFRESCGSDWYQGYDVSVFRLRSPLPTERRHYSQLRSTIEFHNRAFDAGWFLVAKCTEEFLDGIHPYIPRVPRGLDTHSIWTDDESRVVTRHHPTLHRMEYKTLVFREVKRRDPLDGYGALKKSLTHAGNQPATADHLERAGRSQCVGVNIGWIAADILAA